MLRLEEIPLRTIHESRRRIDTKKSGRFLTGVETEAPAEGALSGQNACQHGAWRRLELPVVHKICCSRIVEGKGAISVGQGDQSNYASSNVWRRIRLNIYTFSYISLVYIPMNISDYVLTQEHENPYR